MKNLFCTLSAVLLILSSTAMAASEEPETITPHKFTDSGMPAYAIPAACRFTTKRLEAAAPDIVYYFRKPKASHYPIAIMCGGSSSKDYLHSIIHFHRYFLEEFMELGVGVLTVEQWGIDGSQINEKDFMAHYTRSQRLKDHQTVIAHLKGHPPMGWNGKLIFLGASEGGPIVTALTTQHADRTLATINWSGAGDWSWKEELWAFLQKFVADNMECPHHLNIKSCDTCFTDIRSRKNYDAHMQSIIDNPASDTYFFNMTNKYHADALSFPVPDYGKIRTPFLVVAGALDSIILSSDAFVAKAKSAGAPVTYLRVEDMDHYVRRRPDIIKQSFDWLKSQIT